MPNGCEMSARLKAIFPKGLRGRAILILLFPVIMLQLIVAATIIQRHFDRVTRQMVANVEPHVRLVLSRISSASDIDDAMNRVTPITVPVNMKVVIDASPERSDADRRGVFDLSGKVVIEELRSAIPSISSINLLEDDSSLEVRATTPHGTAVITLQRGVVSPSNPHQLLVLMAFAGIVMTLIAYAFLRNQLRPIIRLADASKAFGQGQHLAIHEAGATEVREATRAFIDMRDRIEEHLEQRAELLTNIGHDLRTPLTRIRIGLEMLDDTPETNALISDVKNMTFMIRELLDFTRDTIAEKPELISPLELLEELVEKSTYAGQEISLVNRTRPTRRLQVLARPTAMIRAVENLVGNADNYAGECRLTLNSAPGILRIIVEDDGPGIPAEDRDRALRAFSRLDRARNLDRGGGVGLGLTIALDVAVQHGGSLTLGSSDDLGGLKATLILPLAMDDNVDSGEEGVAEEKW